MSTIAITKNGQSVTSVESDPLNQYLYAFTSSNLTMAPVVGYSMGLSNNNGYGAPNCTITSNPFTVTIPPQTDPSPYGSPSVISTNGMYSNQSTTNGGNAWYLEFSFDMSNFTRIEPDFHLGTSEFFIGNMGLDTTTNSYSLKQYIGVSSNITIPLTSSRVKARFQFPGNNTVYLFINDSNVPNSPFTVTGNDAQSVLFANIYSDGSRISERTQISLVLSNISWGLPYQTFTPTLRYNNSSSELLRFFTPPSAFTSNVILFTTPLGRISVEPDAPIIVADQTLSNEIQASVSFTVSQVGTIPDSTIIVDPVLPTTLKIKEFVPITYSFTTTNYYPPTTSTPTFFSTGATSVSITGTSNAVIAVPALFKDIKVTGDRQYTYGYLYDNKINLSIAVPYLTSNVDSAFIGFGGLTTAQLLFLDSGANQLIVNGYYLPEYTTPQTMLYVPTGEFYNFLIYLVDSTGYQHLVYDGLAGAFGDLYTFTMQFTCAAGYDGSATTLTVNAPAMTQVTLGAPPPLVLDPFASGSSYFAGYSTGLGTSNLVLGSSAGFTSLPPAVPVLLKVDSLYNLSSIVATTNSLFSIVQGTIISTPDIYDNPPASNIYTPFGSPYVFNVPFVSNTTLVSYNSDAVIRSYLTSNVSENTITFNAPNGFTTPFTNGLLSIQALDSNGGVLASINYYVSASSNIITSDPSFTGSLSLYKYDPFSQVYGLQSGVAGITLNVIASSSEVRTFVTPSTPGTTLTYAGTYNTSYATPLNLIVNATNSSNAVVASISNAVYVNPGHFYNPIQSVFSFYQYEDVAVTYGSSIAFDTWASLDTLPASTPVLPSGLSFARVSGSSNHFVLKGSPQFQSPSNQYLIIGVNSVTNQIVTNNISINVNPARINIIPSSQIINNMQIDVPITPVTFTSIQPSALTINYFQYLWDTLPDGLVFTDKNGVIQQNTYKPYVNGSTSNDDSLTIILTGTPTSNAAYSFINSGVSTYTMNLSAVQSQPKGVQTNQKASLSFSFAQTLLFTPVVVPPLYAFEPLTISNLIIKASAYFPTGNPIVSITCDSLPEGLSLSNAITDVPNYVNLIDYSDGVYVSGTPTTLSSNIYTFTASTGDGFTQTLPLTIPILQDVVTFSSTTPASVTGIVSRSITPIVFTAASLITTQTITYSTSFDLVQYGLSLVTENGSATLSGTPILPLATTTLVITASDTIGTEASVSFPLTINADQAHFASVSLNFFENVAVTPVQFSATTDSGRPIISFTSPNLPQGLLLSLSGLLTGTPLVNVGGTFSINASTGYPPGMSYTFSYSLIPDNVIILMTTNPLYFTGSTFSVDAFRSLTYSGSTSTLTLNQSSIKNKNGGTTLIPTLSLDGFVLTGSFASGAESYSPFTFDVVSGSTTLTIQLYFNGSSGSLSTNVSPGSLVFTSPSSLTYLFYQHCPIPTIQFALSGASGFVYFYTNTSALPVGLVFTPDSSGTFATITGTPAVYHDGIVGVTVYAINNGNLTAQTIQIRIITPYFVNPQQNGSSAYTALLRNQVFVNAAQNARNNVVFPATDASLGSLQSPGAPDVLGAPEPCTKK